MSKELFERLNQMSVDEIIAEGKDDDTELLTEEFEHPLSDREATQYFQSKGVLSATELNILMHNKMLELWENDGCNGA